MNKIINIYKPIGLTPLAVIKQLKQVHPVYAKEKITYAGRLDPLAHGILILLIGDAINQKEQILNLPKTYEFEILLGIETDTYDVLGLIKDSLRHPELACPEQSRRDPESIDSRFRGNDDILIVNSNVNLFVNELLGKSSQEYPPYSSRTVQGKPLFWWAKENKLTEIEIPKHEIEIYEFELLSQSTVIARPQSDEAIYNSKNKESLETIVKRNINLITGDFRQEEILQSWEDFFKGTKRTDFTTLRFRIACSSGTYVRSLAQKLGQRLGTGAITLEIFRTKVGKYTVKEAMRLDSQKEAKSP